MIENDLELSFDLIFVAGGVGKRMGVVLPKQYMTLSDKPLACHSLETFMDFPELERIVVVCDLEYQQIFEDLKDEKQFRKPLIFAKSGKERQDSVYQGFQALIPLKKNRLICIHDSVRPFITAIEIRKTLKEASSYGAAVLAIPVKATMKISTQEGFVAYTPKRNLLWEMQTPQIIRGELLQKGFSYAKENQIEVTDDVSLVELLGNPVKIVRGEERNFKVTTPEDYQLAVQLVKSK